MQQIDGGIYGSLLLRQQEMMKDSSIFVFDVSKEINLVPMDPLLLLLYVTGLMPLVPGVTMSCGKFGVLSFKPTQLERDDHLIIIKEPNGYTSKQVLAIVNTFAQDLPESILIKIGEMLQKFIATKKCETIRSQKMRGTLSKISTLQLSSRLTWETKESILKLWFSNAIEGPFCITRALDYVEFDNDGLSSDAICCESLTRLKKCISSAEFWQFKMQFIIIMDEHYFVISGRESEIMKYRLNTGFNYIGLRDFIPITDRLKEITVAEYDQLYVEGFDKIENDYNGYRMVIVKNEQGKYRLRLRYGAGVFLGMMSCLIEVVNGERFDCWCRFTEGVRWEIWSGRDEQNKLRDYRKMKQEIGILRGALGSAMCVINNNNNCCL